MASSLSDALMGRIEANVPTALTTVGEAWAQASADAAPVVTGRLRQSVRFEMTGATTGRLVMVGYGRPVALGTPALTDSARAGAARRRYLRKVGRTVQHPNDFPIRAWQSPAVRDALRQLPVNILVKDPRS